MTPVAVVTGAADGIGWATCDVLENYGWDVVAVDREPVERAHVLQLDIADPTAVIASLGPLPRIDALVNNAAVQLQKSLLKTSIDEWDEVVSVNLRGAFVCLKACIPRLKETRGSVVNVASVHAVATSSKVGAYVATKGGLAALTRAAAIELAPRGIRVNAVLPGAVDTPALREGLVRRAHAHDTLLERTPLGRLAQPREVGEAIAFLIDGNRAGFITGQELVVDGGALAQLSTG